MRRRTQPRDPLAPIEFVTTVLLAFNAFMILMTLGILLLNPGHTSLPGEGRVCVEVSNGAASAYLPRGGASSSGSDESGARTPPPKGVTVNPQRVAVCARDIPERVWREIPGVTGEAPRPTAEQRWWNGLSVWPPFIFGMGALAQVWLLARRARREGFFVPPVALGLVRLGAFLAIGSVVSSVVVLLARKQLLDTLLPTGGYWDIGLHPSWSTLLMGAGLVTIGRVMGHAVAMREDLDATV